MSTINSYGYIYLRSHESYDKYNAYKLGKTEDCIGRNSVYISSEIKRGEFIMILQVSIIELSKIEIDLQKHFKQLNIFKEGGTEFFGKSIIELIKPYLEEKGYDFKEVKYLDLERNQKITENNNSESLNSTDELKTTNEIIGIKLQKWQK